ncbi:MAG: hypothetical protein FWH35_09060 [Treponema sp.]|nr:hypothetical protein [Treponema sp.]
MKGFSIFLLLLFSLVGCSRNQEDFSFIPPVTHPLKREYIGFAVITGSFTHLLDEPGGDLSKGYLRRGTVVRILERRLVTIRENPEPWVLAEGNYSGPGSPSQGWLQESSVDIYDNESRAVTASKAIIQ